MSSASLKYLCLLAPFMLGACGEGYEVIRTSDISPYGNARTAGSTIAYVQAKLMPERTFNLETVSESSEVQINTAQPVQALPSQVLKDLEEDLDKVFQAKQRK